MLDTLLQPLCEATESTLTPPQLARGDFLYVGLDKNARKFQLELKTLRPATVQVHNVVIGESEVQTISRPTRTIKVAGEEWVEDWREPSPSARDFLTNRFPEGTWAGKKGGHAARLRWDVAVTDVSALILHHGWPKDRLIFRDDVVRDIFYALVRRFFAQEARAAMIARFKEKQAVLLDRFYAGELDKDGLDEALHDAVPRLPDDWLEHPNPDRRLSAYQKVGVLASLGSDGFALHMDRGTGKTPTAIQLICMEAMRHRRDTGKMFRVLVVVPPQVVDNWQREIAKFATVKCKSVIIRANQIERIRLVAMGVKDEPDYAAGICIVPYDSMVPSIEALRRVPWNRVICDESHFFKSHTTNRFWAVQQLRDVSGRRLNLTGTPIGNHAFDLWSQLEFLGEGLSGFQAFNKFRRFYGVYEQEGGVNGVEKLVGLKNCSLIQERLARLSFAVTKKEALPWLPDKVYDQHSVAMTERQAVVYKQVAEELYAEIEDKLSRNSDSITVNNALTMLLRLAQITSGFVTWDAKYDPDSGAVTRPRRVEQIGVNNPKLEATVELVRDSDPDCKVIIWACWVEDIVKIHERLTAEGFKGATFYGATPQDERQPNVDAFNNDPEVKYLVCNAQSAGEGLNLLGYDLNDPDPKTYCGHEIFFSQNWSAILRQQAEDRAHRRGTRMPVRITDLVVPGTIDETIRDRVQDKRELAATATDVRNILQSILKNLDPLTDGQR